MKKRPVVASAALVVANLLPLRAQADHLIGARFDVEERSHAVQVRVDRGHATLVVERSVANPGPRSDQTTFLLSLPNEAVAVRLRSAGIDPAGRPIWFEGELMEATEAAAKYQELTGFGQFQPKDPALLAWREQGSLSLQIFPVPPRGQKLVEYTLELPARYEQGRYRFELPALGTAELPAKLHFTPVHGGDAIEVNGVPVSPKVAVTADAPVAVSLQPRGVPLLTGTLAEVVFGEKRVLSRAAIRVAPKLGVVPRGAAVVVVLDTSRSVEDELGASLGALRAYLGHMPDAEVRVLTFDRHVRAPFGGTQSVRQALSSLSAYEPETANGSALDDALLRADADLATRPAGERRMVVVTDFRTRAAFTPERLASLHLRSGAVVHLATVTLGAPSLERDDGSPWAATARASGGLLWRAAALDRDDGAARTVFEEWARPKRLEHVELRGGPDRFHVPDMLWEGAGVADFSIVSEAVGRFEVLGELWSRPIQLAVLTSEQEGRLWSALVFGSQLFGELSAAEQMILARRGRAVSPVTSYLAIEPGVRPSTDGFEPVILGGSGIGDGASGQGFGVGAGHLAGAIRSRMTHQEYLDSFARAAWLNCGGGGGEADIDLETTGVEIVDVTRVTVRPSPSPTRLHCLGEQAWSWRLPGIFNAERATWSAHVRAGAGSAATPPPTIP